MEFSVSTDLVQLAARAKLTIEQVQHVIALLDAGFSIPYLARYRQVEVGNLTEEALFQLQGLIQLERQLADRKQTALRAIAHQGQLTAELEQAIRQATTLRIVDDLYLPFRRRKRLKDSHSTPAPPESLFSLVPKILDGVENFDLSAELATLTASDQDASQEFDRSAELRSCLQQHIAEHFLHQPAIRQALREAIAQHGVLVARPFVDPADSHDETAPPDPPVSDDIPVMESAADPELTAVDHEPPVERTEDSTAQPDVAEPQPKEEKPPGLDDQAARRAAAQSIAQLRREQRREVRRKRRKRLEGHYRPFFHFRKSLPKVSACEWAAIDRGERLRVLELHYDVPIEKVLAVCMKVMGYENHPYRELVRESLHGHLPQEIALLAKEVQRDLVTESEVRWQNGQREKFQRLLIRQPMDQVVLAIEPQIRRESTVVVLDRNGRVVTTAMISFAKESNPQPSLEELIVQHQVPYIVVGDSPGCRDVYSAVAEIQDRLRESHPLELALVRSAGTGMFARCAAAARELHAYPDNVRRTVSLGRRFQNPLHEYVKLDVGRVARLLFGEETRSESYDASMEGVVRSVVARLGIDVNETDESLLRFVPALNSVYAQKLVQARKEIHGFPHRQALLSVEGIDQQALQQAVAFLRVRTSENLFDGTPIHPQDETVARAILDAAGLSDTELRAFVAPDAGQSNETSLQSRDEWRNKLRGVNVDAVAATLSLDRGVVLAIRHQLIHLADDPMAIWSPPPTRMGPINLDQLQRNDIVMGIVSHLAPFGAFMDLGDKLTGLLHVSRISDQYIGDPRELLDEGEPLLMWVVDIDREKRQIGLSLIPPREHRERQPRRRSSAGPPVSKSTAQVAANPHMEKKPRTGRQFGKRSSAPIAPITDGMKAGTEPMRTFSDLAQFFDLQKKGGKRGDRPKG